MALSGESVRQQAQRCNSEKSLYMSAQHLAGAPFTAVLLAAGAGSRLGGRPKALLEVNGVPLIHRLITALTDACVTELVVVLGHHAAHLEPALHNAPKSLLVRFSTVTNARPDDGQSSSLRLGLQSIASKSGAVIISLCDQPLIDAKDMTDLMHEFRQRGEAQMLVPRVAGKPGNPVLIAAALRDEWLAGDVNATGQRWRKLHPERVQWFDSDNEHYRVDIDTDEDIVQFNQTAGQALRWPTG